jgi:hypothetical protein
MNDAENFDDSLRLKNKALEYCANQKSQKYVHFYRFEGFTTGLLNLVNKLFDSFLLSDHTQCNLAAQRDPWVTKHWIPQRKNLG